MEIHKAKIVLVTGYGAERYEFDLPEPTTNEAVSTTQYKLDHAGQDMTLTISRETCHDMMSGEEFENKVEVIFRGETLRGCGRVLH